jgi:hypothetical protein
VLEFDDNDVDCERDDEIVVFVRVGDASDENDCEDVMVEDEVVEVGGGGKGISKKSTAFE